MFILAVAIGRVVCVGCASSAAGVDGVGLRTSPVSRRITVTVSGWMRIVTAEPFVDGANAEVMHAAGAAETDLAEAVDVVLTDAVVRIVALSRWGGCRPAGLASAWPDDIVQVDANTRGRSVPALRKRPLR
jgi:hypothetical protein